MTEAHSRLESSVEKRDRTSGVGKKIGDRIGCDNALVSTCREGVREFLAWFKHEMILPLSWHVKKTGTLQGCSSARILLFDWWLRRRGATLVQNTYSLLGYFSS